MGRQKKITEQADNSTVVKERDKNQILNLKKADSGNVLPLIASEDITLEKGVVFVPTIVAIKDERQGLIVSTYDNAMNGICVEDGERLHSAQVIVTSVGNGYKIKVPIVINDDVNIVRYTDFNTRVDKLKIKAGTHVADLVLL